MSKDIDDISIVPTWLGNGKQETHKYLFWQHIEGNIDPSKEVRAVRMGQWKGIGMPGAIKLYDLSTDIAEKHDLAAQHPDIAKQIGDFMAEAWVAPRRQQDDGKYTGREPETVAQRCGPAFGQAPQALFTRDLSAAVAAVVGGDPGCPTRVAFFLRGSFPASIGRNFWKCFPPGAHPL